MTKTAGSAQSAAIPKSQAHHIVPNGAALLADKSSGISANMRSNVAQPAPKLQASPFGQGKGLSVPISAVSASTQNSSKLAGSQPLAQPQSMYGPLQAYGMYQDEASSTAMAAMLLQQQQQQQQQNVMLLMRNYFMQQQASSMPTVGMFGMQAIANNQLMANNMFTEPQGPNMSSSVGGFGVDGLHSNSVPGSVLHQAVNASLFPFPSGEQVAGLNLNELSTSSLRAQMQSRRFPNSNLLNNGKVLNHRKKRQGVKMSCDRCCSRHQKCNGGRPCSRCVRSGMGDKCTYNRDHRSKSNTDNKQKPEVKFPQVVETVAGASKSSTGMSATHSEQEDTRSTTKSLTPRGAMMSKKLELSIPDTAQNGHEAATISNT